MNEYGHHWMNKNNNAKWIRNLWVSTTMNTEWGYEWMNNYGYNWMHNYGCTWLNNSRYNGKSISGYNWMNNCRNGWMNNSGYHWKE